MTFPSKFKDQIRTQEGDGAKPLSAPQSKISVCVIRLGPSFSHVLK